MVQHTFGKNFTKYFCFFLGDVVIIDEKYDEENEDYFQSKQEELAKWEQSMLWCMVLCFFLFFFSTSACYDSAHIFGGCLVLFEGIVVVGDVVNNGFVRVMCSDVCCEDDIAVILKESCGVVGMWTKCVMVIIAKPFNVTFEIHAKFKISSYLLLSLPSISDLGRYPCRRPAGD